MSLILLTLASAKGSDLFESANIGQSFYLNPSRFANVYTNNAGATTIDYVHQFRGFKSKYCTITVTQSLASVLAANVSSNARVNISINKIDSTQYTPSVTNSISVKDIVYLYQPLSTPTTSMAIIQKGIWGSNKYYLAQSAASVNAGISVSGVGSSTIVAKIGYPGSLVDNFTFTSAANATAQNIQVATIPALALVQSIQLLNTAAFAGTGISAFNVTLGTASAGNQILASTDVHALNTFEPGTIPAQSASAINVWLGATPVGLNWSAITAGELKLVITYQDIANM